MILPLLVAKVQRGLIAMMAVGHVQPRRAEDLRKLVKSPRAADRPDGVPITVFTRDRQARWLGHGWRDDRTNRRRWVLIEREDRAQVRHDRAREREPVRLGPRVRLLVGQDATAKWFQFDNPQDAPPHACLTADRVDELMAVDVEAGTRLPAQDAVRQPLLKEAGGPSVLVVLRRIGR